MQCNALLLAVQYGYTILQAILVQFLQFVQYDEHSYMVSHLLHAYLIHKLNLIFITIHLIKSSVFY